MNPRNAGNDPPKNVRPQKAGHMFTNMLAQSLLEDLNSKVDWGFISGHQALEKDLDLVAEPTGQPIPGLGTFHQFGKAWGR